MPANFEATAPIKLVIWDLDDTFWSGTLSEGGVTIEERNIEIVRILTDRGIMSSIVSKNDLEPVQRLLTEHGVWDYFIFPKVAWTPKGSLIESIIEQAALRPDNVLFIDDNSINLEEARFRFPAMMTAYPPDVLPTLLDLPQAAGKDDRTHSRLNQYKRLEKKVEDQQISALSNVEFLRQCNIKVRFDYDIETNLDRIVELVNRSNQLNYTKVRLENQEAITEFRDQLTRHDVIAAGIFASDKYGSHGLIGFYMQQKNERSNRLIHFVWSCRMMNAGLEQFVYERLGSPEVKLVGPVSNPIKVFDHVDWVAEAAADEEEVSRDASRLLLLGSCDLTAVASYCSADRQEFVNGVKQGIMTRFDDFGFILSDPSRVAASTALPKMPAWDGAEFKAFHDALGSSEVLIISLSGAMKGAHCLTDDDVVVRIHPDGLGHHIDHDPRASFLKGCKFYENSSDQKIALLIRSLKLVARSTTGMSRKFLLGANTRDVGDGMSGDELQLLSSYNDACEDFCKNRPDWTFVSIDEVVTPDKLVDVSHYTRTGYLDIANFINAKLAAPALRSLLENEGKDPHAAPLTDFIRAGRRVSRLHTFGRRQGRASSYLRQAIKMTPLSGIFRKVLAAKATA